MGPEFFQTPMGRKFFGADLPKLIKAIEENTAELKRANDLKERELSKGCGTDGNKGQDLPHDSKG